MFESVDVIKVTVDEIKNILEWRNKNLEVVRNYQNVLEEAVITVAGSPNDICFYFKAQTPTITQYKIFMDNILVAHCIVQKQENNLIKIIRVGNGENFEIIPRINQLLFLAASMSGKDRKVKDHHQVLSEIIADNATIHASLMAYIGYKSQEVEIIEEDFLSPHALKKALRYNRNTSETNKVKIKKKVIKLKNPSYKNITKKEIKRHTQCWGVRGHVRHYKDGTTTFVKPYEKGEGVRKKKEYSVEVIKEKENK